MDKSERKQVKPRDQESEDRLTVTKQIQDSYKSGIEENDTED
ncbi:hypothetical protein EDD68_10430 [Melghiribacillus thermohalophilus]|uniref:Uncharacterized protein n=1 Tax=Melghiribacillus thermohalophilus TaxID=1324956 RepID=A0A4R3NCP8_9BACI|nr:hypothetical protein [Melghiribacillus thermohalophilus]TCT24963.1 hypothetical protein EDD68_10430 [Melghiribacillus thermohalophilus]